jgi:mgtE-like transporter
MMFVISLGITFLAFRNGWDPDNVSAPIIASSGDILTIPILFFSAWVSLNIPEWVVTFSSLGILGIIGAVTVIVLSRYRREVRSILVGMFPIALSAIVISTFSGIVLGASFDLYLKGTIFLLLVPAFNGQGGSMGSILGSRLTSSGYLGEDRITLLPNRTGRTSTVTLWMIAVVVFTFMAFSGAGIGLIAGIELPGWAPLMVTMLLGATIITLLTSLIAYYVTYLAFKLGLDPDNVVIPLLTSLMDVVGSGSLIICILAVEHVL